MARAKIGLQFEGWEETIAKLDKLSNDNTVKKVVGKALNESKEYVTPKLEEAISTGNLPAKGKYSSAPHVKNTLDKDSTVEWQGLTGEIKVGFNLKEAGGMASIFLMYGTPRMSPAKGLKNAIYGSTTKKKIAQIQSDTINNAIKEIMEG